MILKKRLIFIVMAFVVTLSSLALLFAPFNYKTVSADSLEDRYNLVVYPNTTLNNLGVTISNDGQYLYINGVKNTASLGYMNFDFPINAGTYTFSINSISNLSYFFIVDGVRYNYTSVPITFTITNNSTFNLNFVTAIGGSYNDIQIKPMLNKGSIAYPFIVPLASNPSYYLGLQNGYNQGYQDSLKENSFANYNDSLGVFENASFTFTAFNPTFDLSYVNLFDYLNNYNGNLQYNLLDFTTLKGYNNGFTALNTINSDYSFYIRQGFDVSPSLFSHYRIIFNTPIFLRNDLQILVWDSGFYKPYLYNNAFLFANPLISISYIDGTFTNFAMLQDNRIVDTINNKAVLSIDILFYQTTNVMPSLVPLVNLDGYNDGYLDGFQDGDKKGYDNGYLQGSQSGYDKGYRDGLAFAEDSDLVTFISAVVGAPVTVVSKFLNFEIFGVNIFGFISGLLTLMLIIKVLSLFLGGKLR